MAEIKIAAESRTEFGKGAARRTRRDNKVPAVLYGHGTDPVHITLPAHETQLALRAANALLAISIDGKAPQLALPKQVQRDPIKRTLDHVDLIIVRKGEKVSVDVPVVIVGEVGAETLIMIDIQAITLEAEATHIPAHVEINVEGLVAPHQILARDLKLPEGSTLAIDPEALVVNLTLPITEAALEAELETPEGEAAAEARIEDAAKAAEAEAEAEKAEKAEKPEKE